MSPILPQEFLCALARSVVDTRAGQRQWARCGAVGEYSRLGLIRTTSARPPVRTLLKLALPLRLAARYSQSPLLLSRCDTVPLQTPVGYLGSAFSIVGTTNRCCAESNRRFPCLFGLHTEIHKDLTLLSRAEWSLALEQDPAVADIRTQAVMPCAFTPDSVPQGRSNRIAIRPFL